MSVDPELGEWLHRQHGDRSWTCAEMPRRSIKTARDVGDMTVHASGRVARSMSRWEGGAAAPSERYRRCRCAAPGIGPGRFGARRRRR